VDRRKQLFKLANTAAEEANQDSYCNRAEDSGQLQLGKSVEQLIANNP